MPIHDRLVPSPVPTQHKMKAANRISAAALLLLTASLCVGQQPAPAPAPQSHQPKKEAAGTILTVPPGTRILMALVRPVSTKSTKPGDTIYLQTTFPVTAGDKLLIPAGTFLQGTLAGFKRQKEHLQLQMQSATLIFSNGYSVNLPAAPDLTPGPDADVRKEPGHPKAAVASAAGASAGGLAVGGLAAGTQGAVIGGAIGGPVGFVLAEILLNHGSSTQIEAGSPVEIILDRPLLLEERRVADAARQPNRILVATSRPRTSITPKPPSANGTCFTPEIPGTPDTIIPGTPGTPPAVIPGTPAIPGTPYPCPQ